MIDRPRNLNNENTGNLSGRMVDDLSPRKTMLVLVVVIGCFAVLWPKVFYPMLVGSENYKIKPSPIDRTQGCCDVIYEKDVATIKVMTEICSTIIKKDDDRFMSNKELLQKCQNLVLDTCGIDISVILQEQVRLGHSTRQIIEEIRSLNGSLCLKYNFGIAPWKLGVPHRITVKASPSSYIRQERPLHVRSEMVHPAFRERGRAIPQADFAPTRAASTSRLVPKVIVGRPGPIPGMRPTIGGAGNVVPPRHGGTSMGFIMPIYTAGIVIFFIYTIMKMVFKKQPEVLYPPISSDSNFGKEVFKTDRGHLGARIKEKDRSSTLVVNAMSALLEEVDLELSSRRKTNENIQEDVVANGQLGSQEEDQSSVQVLGMETTASRENGQKWAGSNSPILPVAHPQPQNSPPQEIFLEGSLPPQSHVLVTDSATEAQKPSAEEDPAVVLAGKMTLSLISLDSSENGTDESSNCGKKSEERSSSNVSEEFEKIDVEQLEEQINDVIAEAENANLHDYNYSKLVIDEKNAEFVQSASEATVEQTTSEENVKESNETELSSAILTKQEKSLDDVKSYEYFSVESEQPNSELIETLIKESVDAVVGTIQDKKKELDALLLRTEEELAQTTDFVDSKIEQIQKDIAKIEKEQVSIEGEGIGNVLDELKEESTVRDISDTAEEEEEEDCNTIDVEIPVAKISQTEYEVNNIKELIPSVKQDITNNQEITTPNIETLALKEINNTPTKQNIEENASIINFTTEVIQNDPEIINQTIKESNMEVLIQPSTIDIQIQKKDKTDVTNKIEEGTLDQLLTLQTDKPLEDEYVLESDNDEIEDDVENEEGADKIETADFLVEEAILVDKKDVEDIVEESEDDDEECEDEEEEDGEEFDHEIVEYTSDEEEEIEEEEEEDQSDIEEDPKAISHV